MPRMRDTVLAIPIQALLVGALLVWMVVGIMRIPQVQADLAVARGEATVQQRPELVNEYRRTLLQIAGGLVVAVGLYLTYRRIKASEAANAISEAANLASAEANRETLRLTEEGQVTERFTRAIEQLGSHELAIRLGGIYALERIARDSEKDHWTVMEVLSAFIRENATEEANELVSEEAAANGAPFRGRQYKTRNDIQAALVVLGRREEREEPSRLDLSKSWLRSYMARKVRFSNADLSDVNFGHAYLHGANFNTALLIRSNFEYSALSNASFKGALLFHAKISKALIIKSEFSGSKLQWANFTDAVIEGAQFHARDLKDVQCPRASFLGAIIDGLRYEAWMPDPREQWPPPGYEWEDDKIVPIKPAPKPSEPETAPPPQDDLSPSGA